ncbi:thioredoxin-related transmembrane protein 1-like isoform X2 [Littorina saxatilis]
MAPWCPACRSFQSTWQSLAEWSKDLDINVGLVDVTENPGLSGRFLVTSLPTVLHIKDGEFRTYTGPRKESDLLSFVDDKKWKDIEPVSSWTHPNSFQMGAVGFFFKVAMFIRSFYNMMTSEYGIPEWGCYIIFAIFTIIVGLLLGLIFVLCCDWLFPPKYVPAYTIPITKKVQGEEERDDESDVIDDTAQEQGDSQKEDTSVRRRQKPNQEAAGEETNSS